MIIVKLIVIVLNKVICLILLAPECNGELSSELLVVSMLSVIITSSSVDASVDASVGTELGPLVVLVVVPIVGVVTVMGTVVGMVKNGPSVIV